MLLPIRFILLLTITVHSALCQNAEPSRQFHQLGSSSVAADSDARRDYFPPEGGGKDSLDSHPRGNEKGSTLQQQRRQHGKPLGSAQSNVSVSASSRASESLERQSQGIGEDRKKKRRRAKHKQQSWRIGGDERARDNLVDMDRRNRLKKKQTEALTTTAFGNANKSRSWTGKFREERRRNRRRRNRKRMRNRLGLEHRRRSEANDEDSPIGMLMKVLKEKVASARQSSSSTTTTTTSLDDNPLNLSMTRFDDEINEAANVLESSNLTSSYPSQLATPTQDRSRYKPLRDSTVEREFSRHVEREFAESGVSLEEQEDNAANDDDEDEDEDEDDDDNDEQKQEKGVWLPKLDERYQQSSKQPDEFKASLDPERMLGYSRTDEDLPILDLENEVLQRTIKDYNAYMSSSFGSMKNDKDNSEPFTKTRHEWSDRDTLLTEDEEQRGDLSCVNGTFLPAPFVPHALIKYVKSSRPDHEYLEADYVCASGYALVRSNASNHRLMCRDRRWVGRLPVCNKYRNGNYEDKTSSCADLACEQLCRIVDERPECYCREGFRLDGASCIDVNECEEVNEGRGPCEDTCRNLEGSFECSCETRPGTLLAADKRTCQQLSEACSHDNAGCSHTCLASMGRVFCLCPDGFILEDDWKTCQDVNECAVPDLQTEVCRYGCINTPGSYHCAPAPIDALHQQTASKLNIHCQLGYQPNPQAKNCIDVDECATNNGDCSEICENTEGSFFCACEGDERILSADRRNCVVAEQRFEKMDREAVALGLRFHQASGAFCSALNPVSRGYLMCSDSEKSSQYANQEPEEEEDEERERLSIKPGTKCHLKCPQGYELHGEYELTCRADGTWDGPKHGECLRYSKPRLDCPKDVLAELPAGRDEAFVTYEQPSTDLDWFRYVRSKPSWGTRLEANLKLGLHEISFYARHPVSKQQASCTLKISVQEGQAPKVDNCPSDIEVTGKNGSAISWVEPTFTDNIKVTRVTSTQSPGQTFSLGGHKVEYEAADEAGWTTKCTFTVVLRPLAD